MRRAPTIVLRTGVLAVVAGVVGLVLGLSTASAYFRAIGLGDGSGDTGASALVTLTPGTVSPGLYPGAAAEVATVAVNPDDVPARIASLALDPSQGSNGFAVDAGHAGCPLTTFSFPTQTNGGSGWTVPPNGSLAISLPAAVAATTATANACQGATLTVYLRAAA